MNCGAKKNKNYMFQIHKKRAHPTINNLSFKCSQCCSCRFIRSLFFFIIISKIHSLLFLSMEWKMISLFFLIHKFHSDDKHNSEKNYHNTIHTNILWWETHFNLGNRLYIALHKRSLVDRVCCFIILFNMEALFFSGQKHLHIGA